MNYHTFDLIYSRFSYIYDAKIHYFHNFYHHKFDYFIYFYRFRIQILLIHSTSNIIYSPQYFDHKAGNYY